VCPAGFHRTFARREKIEGCARGREAPCKEPGRPSIHGKTLRIGLAALGVTALTLTGCATARPLSVLPSSTWSAAVTADRAGRDFVSALRHGGVAEESLAALIDDGTTLGLELTATRSPV
jgi:hypothetical protein